MSEIHPVTRRSVNCRVRVGTVPYEPAGNARTRPYNIRTRVFRATNLTIYSVATERGSDNTTHHAVVVPVKTIPPRHTRHGDSRFHTSFTVYYRYGAYTHTRARALSLHVNAHTRERAARPYAFNIVNGWKFRNDKRSPPIRHKKFKTKLLTWCWARMLGETRRTNVIYRIRVSAAPAAWIPDWYTTF